MPQLQRTQMRVLQYDIWITHILGNGLHAPDVQLGNLTSQGRSRETAYPTEYAILTLELLPVSAEFLEKANVELQKGPAAAMPCTTARTRGRHCLG